MNQKMLYPLAATILLLGLLFVSLGGGLPALAQQETPEPQIASPVNPVPTEDTPEILPSPEYYTKTLEGGEIVPQAPGETEDLLPGLWLIETIDSAGNVGEYTSLELDTAGYPHISYGDRTNGDLKYAYQDTSGWHIETIDPDGGGDTSLRLDDQGYPHILYNRGSAVYYAYKDASGWMNELVTGKGSSISLALDSTGKPHISYIVRSYFTTNPWVERASLVYSFRDNDSWNSQEIDNAERYFTNPFTGTFIDPGTSIAIDQADHPHISFSKGRVVTSWPPAGRWTASSLIHAFFDGNSWQKQSLRSGSCTRYFEGPITCYRSGAYSNLRLSTTNTVQVSYYSYFYSNDGRSGNYLAYLSDSYSGSIPVVNFYGYSSLAVDSSGGSFLAYRDDTSTQLHMWYHDSAGWHNQLLGEQKDSWRYPSIELDSIDNPIISFYDEPNGDLKLARYAAEGIYLHPSVQSKSATRGEIVAYRLALYNQSGVTDSFILEFGPHAWETLPLANPVGSIPAGGTLAVTVTVQVPVDASWNDLDSVDVIARAQNNPAHTSNIAQLSTHVYAPPRLSIEPVTLDNQLWPGSSVVQMLDIQNGDGITLTYDILSPGPILYFPFDEPAGSTSFSDASGYGNQGSCVGNTCPVAGMPGVIGTAIQLDGLDDYVSVLDDDSLDLSKGMTIAAWVKSNDTSGARVIVAKWNDNTSDHSYIFKDHNSSDKLRIELSREYHNDLSDLAGTTSIPIGNWTHVAVTFDGHLVKLYFNGVEDASAIADGKIRESVTDLLIGALYTGGGILENFNGSMDELLIFNQALSAGEINNLYAHGYEQNNAWMTVSPLTGIVPPNNYTPVQVTFDATGLQPGLYTTTLELISNDPDKPLITIPVSMELIELPYRFYLPVLNH